MLPGTYRVADEALHMELCETGVWLHVGDSGEVIVELLLSEEFSLTNNDGSCEISSYSMGFDEVIAKSIHSTDDLPAMLKSLQDACEQVQKAIKKQQASEIDCFHGDGI